MVEIETNKSDDAKEKIQKILDKTQDVFGKVKANSNRIQFLRMYRKYKRTKIKKLIVNKYKKTMSLISASWKIVLTAVPSFLFFYYLIGSCIVENMDVESGYNLPKDKDESSKTVESMAFLIEREVDDKMWTPNLPPIFPAYVLDNMPNFQTGVISAVRDMVPVIRNFDGNTELQKKEVKKATKLLQYSPKVWLLSKVGAFSIAPSSNSQYRKARKELLKYIKDGKFVASKEKLDAFLNRMSRALLKQIRNSENYQQEHSSDWFDFKCDDVFYFNRGYAYGMWQIARALGVDFKAEILEADTYNEWTYLISSLQRTAYFKPTYIRNGSPDSTFTPNHLLIQNSYLYRALTSIEKIRNRLMKEKNADKN